MNRISFSVLCQGTSPHPISIETIQISFSLAFVLYYLGVSYMISDIAIRLMFISPARLMDTGMTQRRHDGARINDFF